jgi:protein-L-isoaspartate O-methyltransferase
VREKLCVFSVLLEVGFFNEGGTGYVARKLALFDGLCSRVYSADSNSELVKWAQKKAEETNCIQSVIPVLCSNTDLVLPERGSFMFFFLCEMCSIFSVCS